MKRNLIVIGGGLLQVPLIERAKSMGLNVLVFDISPEAPGMQIADESVIMSTQDSDGCVRKARKLSGVKPIHGVITSGTDASKVVAAIAGALKLPGIRYADAEAASNKVLMRKRLSQHGIAIPRFISVWSLKDTREAMYDLTFPLVLKPADNMGARGVIKIRNRDEINLAFHHAKKYSPTGEMILEEFMEGPELSIDAVTWNGNFRITGIADRIINKEPFFIELGHNMPSRMPRDIQEDATKVMIDGMRALGIHTGAGKGDLKVTPDGIMIGELAARLSGGFMSTHTYPLHSNVDLMRAAVQIALGEEPDELEPTENRVVIERGILGTAGKIISISGMDAMKKIPGIEYVYFTKNPGDILPQLTSNLDKAGHIIATGSTLEEAEDAISQAMEHFQILVDDAFSVDWEEVENRARLRFDESICRVCKICNGVNCVSGVPGMGGLDSMNTFVDNSRALAEIKIIPRYIRPPVMPDTNIELFGRKFEHPIMAAPITGTDINMNDAISEYEFTKILLEACRDNGSVAWVGDGAPPAQYSVVLKALEAVDGFGIIIFKPRADSKDMLARFKEAEKFPVLAVGMDIDAISFKTLEINKQATIARPFDAIRYLRDSTKLPFILKGIMTPEDALQALKAGVDLIVVSNHGGRVMDDMPGTARILEEIVDAVAGKIPVLVDGSIRSGRDVFKMLALGADAVLVGRPLVIAAVGGEQAGVKFMLSRYRQELTMVMNLCGTESLSDINSSFIKRNGSTNNNKRSRSIDTW